VRRRRDERLGSPPRRRTTSAFFPTSGRHDRARAGAAASPRRVAGRARRGAGAPCCSRRWTGPCTASAGRGPARRRPRTNAAQPGTRADVARRNLASWADPFRRDAQSYGWAYRTDVEGEPMSEQRSVTSRDGTTIAFERTGEGPPVILVAAALSDRSDTRKLAALLAPSFSVVNYDRRGRGASGDTPPYALERECEDIEALVKEVGGSALLFGSSSGRSSPRGRGAWCASSSGCACPSRPRVLTSRRRRGGPGRLRRAGARRRPPRRGCRAVHEPCGRRRRPACG
jgi:hypothetical protein